MRRLVLPSVLLVLVWPAIASSQTVPAEKEVRQAENARREALLRNDVAALDRLIADSYLATLGDGQVVRKAEALAVNRAGARQVESWEETDLVIRLYGDTAVVTGLAAVKDRLTAGTSASQILRNESGAREFTFRFTHIWAKIDGRWQLVGRHISGRSLPYPAQASSEGRDREEIIRLLHQWTDAMTVGDAKALDQLLADNFTFVSPRGRIIVKSAYVANRDPSRGVAFATESAQFDDVSVQFYDGFAVSTSRYTTKALTRDAGIRQETSGEYTRTDTWITVDGRWRALAMQLTPIGYAGAHAATESAALHSVSSGDLTWTASPMYPGAQLTVLHGQPYSGGFAVRMKRPASHFEKAHRHESDEHVSVLSGTLHVGVGDGSNRANARAIRAGGYVVIPSGTLHYSWTDGDVLEEIHWDGPAALVYSSERTQIALLRATLESYVGTYRFDDSATTLTITLEDDRLMGRLSGAPASFQIFAESETRFFLKSAPPGSSVGVNQPVEFMKDANRVVTGVSLGNRKAMRLSR